MLLKGEAVVFPFCTAVIQLAYADQPGGTTATPDQTPSSSPEAAPAIPANNKTIKNLKVMSCQ